MKKKLFAFVLLLPALVHAQNYSSISPSTSLFTNSTPTGITGDFRIFHPFNSSYALAASTDGTGGAAFAGITNTMSSASAFSALTYGTGRSGYFQILSTGSPGTALEASTNGNGKAGFFLNTATNSTANVLEVKTVGKGKAGYFQIDNDSSNSIIVDGLSNGLGTGGRFILSNTENENDGFRTDHYGGGDAVNAYAFGTGKAAYFTINNPSNSSTGVYCSTSGTGNTLVANHSGSSGNIAIYQNSSVNMARIDKTGKGFFNGGTQNGGADIAEAFDVVGATNTYEAGDVLTIATSKNRTVEKSSKAYSTLVAGVYATKPGVLLTEENIDTDISDKVPMGVVGVIPTKVCNESGEIHIGDMLVTSSRIGYAMKGNPKKIKIGQVIGKALEDFNAQTGKINVLVSVR